MVVKAGEWRKMSREERLLRLVVAAKRNPLKLKKEVIK